MRLALLVLSVAFLTPESFAQELSKEASSPEFVGEFWLGEVSELVI
jgi:hypothetical protein